MTPDHQTARARPPLHAAEYEIGDFVYLRTDPEQRRRMITGILVRQDGYAYFVSFIDFEEKQYYGIELSREPDNALRIGSPD